MKLNEDLKLKELQEKNIQKYKSIIRKRKKKALKR